MKISARNQIKGRVLEIKDGAVMSMVKIDAGNGIIITSIISKDSVGYLNLAKNDEIIALIKSTEVIIAKE